MHIIESWPYYPRLLSGLIGLGLGFTGTSVLLDPQEAGAASARNAGQQLATFEGTRSHRDIEYPNCNAVKAAGAAPLRRGQPGYGVHLDRDHDGLGCE